MKQDDCMAFLEPWFERIHSPFPKALRLYNEDYAEHIRAEHNDSVAAHCVHVHSIAEYEREFAEEPGFHFLTVRGLQVLNIRDIVVARFKKVDAEGRHRNADTQQQRDFDNQEPLPGLPSAALRVTFGYEPDPAFSRCERVIVACPEAGGISWAAQIVEGDEAFGWEDITPVRLIG